MWSIKEIKERGRTAFKGNYWPCVLVALLMSLFAGSSASYGASTATSSEGQVQDPQVIVAALVASLVVLAVIVLFKIFVSNPIQLGGAAFFTENIEGPVPFKTIGKGFKNYGHNFLVMLVRDIYVFLWSLLFIVPGIIKLYSYRMVPYILAEHPELSANEVINRSREMMNGNKWRSFLLDLSFLGWILLGVMSAGIVLVFWTNPYMESAQAALYAELRDKAPAIEA